MTKKTKGHCELRVLAAMTSWHVPFQLQRKLVDDYTANFVPLTDRYGAWLDSVRVSPTEQFCDRI